MSIFSLGKDGKKDGGNPVVMAYLEDALRLKAPAMLIDPHKNELPCNIGSIREEEGTMNLQLHANLLAEKGAKVGFVVIVDSLRIYGTSKLQEVKPGHATIDIPGSFDLAERRKKQRAKINPREGTTATLLSGLFDGIGITGLVDNISEGGVRVKVEKALDIKTEKPISVTGRTLKTNQIFPILKIAKIPRCIATIECGGRLIYTEVQSGVTYLGLSFEEMKSEFTKVIEGFVAGRVSPLPTSLPPRARRSKEEFIEVGAHGGGGKDDGADKDAKDAKDAKEPKESKESKEKEPKEGKYKDDGRRDAPPPEPEQPQQAQPVTAATPAAPAASTVPPQSEQTGPIGGRALSPLQKLKRKTKTIVLCGTDEDLVSGLEKLFKGEGYGKVVVPQGMEEIIGAAPPGGAGLIVLALDIPFENCLGLAKTIQAQIPDPTPMVLISDDIPPGVGAANDAQAAGVSMLLPKAAKMDEAVFGKMEELMGIKG